MANMPSKCPEPGGGVIAGGGHPGREDLLFDPSVRRCVGEAFGLPPRPCRSPGGPPPEDAGVICCGCGGSRGRRGAPGRGAPLPGGPKGEVRPEGPAISPVGGTMVWDTIHDPTGHRCIPSRSGGDRLALGALCRRLRRTGRWSPSSKVGRDRVETPPLPPGDSPGCGRKTPSCWFPNPTTGWSSTTPTEAAVRASSRGGVTPWDLARNGSRLSGGATAVYVNFTSPANEDGSGCRPGAPGRLPGPDLRRPPILFLGIRAGGAPGPAPPPGVEDWCECFDVVD